MSSAVTSTGTGGTPAAPSRAAASRRSALVTTAHGRASRSSAANSSAMPGSGTTSARSSYWRSSWYCAPAATSASSRSGRSSRIVPPAGRPCATASAAAVSTPYRAHQLTHARSTAASESTRVPSMSSRTARTSARSTVAPLGYPRSTSIRGRGMRGEAERWRPAADLLALIGREPGIPRADAARRLGLSSGSATEITGRLRELALLRETRAPVRGRGRPTTVLTAHPAGPLVLGIELRHEDWRCALAGVDGRAGPATSGRHDGRDPTTVLAALRRVVLDAHRAHPGRLRAVSLAVAGTVRGDRIVQAAGLGWADV